MAKLASLVVDVRTNTAKFNQGMDRVEKKMANFSKAAKNLTGVLVTLGGAAALGAVIKKNLELADAIGKSADATDFGVEAFQEYSFAASQAGIDTSQFTSNMTAFVKRVGEARANTGPLVSFLKKYDETLLTAIQNTTNQEQALDLMADAIQRASTNTDKAALANAAFSRAGVNMVNLMRDGAEGMEEVRQRARDLSLVMSEDLVRGAEDAGDRIEQMEKFISIKFTKTVAENAETIEMLATTVIDLVESLGQGITALNEFGASLGKALSDFINPVISAEERINDEIKETIKLIREQQDIVEDGGFLGFGASTTEEIEAARAEIAELNNELSRLRDIKLGLAAAGVAQEDEEINPEESPRVILKTMEDELIQLKNEEHLAMLTEQEIKHWNKLKKDWKKNQTERQKFNKMSFKQQTKTVVGEMVNMTQGVAQEDKRLFEINKAAGIANAIINTYQGVSNAIGTYPPPLSFAMAGLQLAAGLAQVNAIRSATFGGGGGAPSIAGSGAAPSTVNTTPLNTIQQEETQAQTQVNITLNGSGYTDENVRDLIESINEQVGDGVELSTT